MSNPNLKYTGPVARSTEVLAIHLRAGSTSLGIPVATDQLRRALAQVPAGSNNVQIATALTALLTLSVNWTLHSHVADAVDALAAIADQLGI